MAKRTQWIPHFTTGNATLDGQHQQLLAQCNESRVGRRCLARAIWVKPLRPASMKFS